MALTDADHVRLRAIATEGDDWDTARRIMEYYHDADRADRTPRGTMYFHLGLLCGIIDRLTDERAIRSH